MKFLYDDFTIDASDLFRSKVNFYFPISAFTSSFTVSLLLKTCGHKCHSGVSELIRKRFQSEYHFISHNLKDKFGLGSCHSVTASHINFDYGIYWLCYWQLQNQFLISRFGFTNTFYGFLTF